MSTRFIKYFLITLLPVSLLSCDEDVKNVKFPDFEQKIVIASFISPSDSSPYFNITSNKRLYSRLNDSESPGNLQGTLSDGITETTLEKAIGGLRLDTSKLRIKPGTDYLLKVESDKGLSADAVCRIPEERDFLLSADTSSVLHQTPGYKSWREFIVDISFTDILGEENYYRLNAAIIMHMTSAVTHKPVRIFQNAYFEKDLFSDSDADSYHTITAKTTTSYDLNYIDSAFISVNLLNTEKSYFLYHRSLRNYNYGDSPFSEATPVYSNINGGLGIFTSFTVKSVTIRLK